ncbi:MAG: carboxymuconolactone decarboxylase family protein [Sulfobacillus acidophilus]|uniref:Carboxymuconolactone decarboxylase family protein n=1 Tax=Sulfobacillus acidophilus TaxID=53633 RepID=A0A2T2WE02_9FIRM|nr:MAG: carboxymuconolactone decarboxylase family protein [Sulfobacillus acidophilus]
MDVKLKELIAIGAAVASGCEPCLRTHVDGAQAAGADAREIETAVNIARAVRLQAVTGFDDAAGQVLRGEPIPVLAAGGGCGCGPGCTC